MPKKYYKIELLGGAAIHVYFETASGIIINFVVKLDGPVKSQNLQDSPIQYSDNKLR